MMNITEADWLAMAVRCGLDPLGPIRNREVARQAAENGSPVDWTRVTGRTTRMLCTALVALERGADVFVLTPSFAIEAAVRRRAEALQIKLVERGSGKLTVTSQPSKLRGARRAPPCIVCERWANTSATPPHRCPPGTVMLYDHTWWEFAPTDQLIEALELEAFVEAGCPR